LFDAKKPFEWEARFTRFGHDATGFGIDGGEIGFFVGHSAVIAGIVVFFVPVIVIVHVIVKVCSGDTELDFDAGDKLVHVEIQGSTFRSRIGG